MLSPTVQIVFSLMFAKIWKHVVFWLRIASIVFAGVVALGFLLSDRGFITVTPGAEKWVWGSSLVIIAVDNVGTLIARRVREDKNTLQNDIDAILMQLFSGISKSKRARFEELGGSVWVKRRPQRIKYLRRRVVELTRLRRLRGMDFPHQSGITFTSQTGVVGECWRTRRSRYRNLYDHSKRYTSEGVSELTNESFSRVGKDSKMGFDLLEFQATSGKYSEIAATPIFSDRTPNKLLGVLSIDRAMPQNGSGEKFQAILNQTRTQEDIEVIVKLIARVLERRD